LEEHGVPEPVLEPEWEDKEQVRDVLIVPAVEEGGAGSY
jgi:hypothetical protein